MRDFLVRWTVASEFIHRAHSWLRRTREEPNRRLKRNLSIGRRDFQTLLIPSQLLRSSTMCFGICRNHSIVFENREYRWKVEPVRCYQIFLFRSGRIRKEGYTPLSQSNERDGHCKAGEEGSVTYYLSIGPPRRRWISIMASRSSLVKCRSKRRSFACCSTVRISERPAKKLRCTSLIF
jgi:hypothetical protein